MMRSPILRHCAPFATWIGLQTLLPTTAAAYAIRSAATALVALYAFWPCGDRSSRPEHSAPSSLPSRPFQLVVGILLGRVVCALWILPDALDWYQRWCVWPLGSVAAPAAEAPYDPAVCGWPLTIAKLVGSAFVIAPVEELFFRSFLYRWLQSRDFLNVPLTRFDGSAFLWMIFLFMLEHDRPLAAALAGAAYGFAAIRWGLCAAIVAHVVTNLALALHVVYWHAWAFW